MKAKKWARKARTILVRLEGPEGDDLHGLHTIEIKDAKKHTIRTRTLDYHQGGQALSTIMTDTQVRLAKNALRVAETSYQLTNEGRTLFATVSISESSRRPNP